MEKRSPNHVIHFLVSHFPSKMVLKAFCNALFDILFAFRFHLLS